MAALRVTPSAVTLSETATLRRQSPRPEEDRQKGYDAAYDDRTIFYDVFHHDGDIVLSGPPLFNLREHVLAGRILIDESAVDPAAVELCDIDRTQSSRIRGVAGATLRIGGLSGPELHAAIGEDHRSLFAGRHAVVTLVRGREHEGLAECLAFHAQTHGADAALVYATRTAPAQQLAQAIAAAGIEVGAVVDWPFPFGPGGGPRRTWDSDFSYISALEHARARFLQHAGGVLNVGATQLVLTDDGRSVFEHASAAPQHVVLFAGRWIEGATDAQREAGQRRGFRDYRHHRLMSTPARWALAPDAVTGEAQWRVRSVGELQVPTSVRVLARDFRNLFNRKAPDRPIDPELDHLDQPLSDALDRSLPRESPDRPAPRGLARVTTRLGLLEKLTRGAHRSRGPDPAPEPADDYGYLFIMTYGRTGSTLMQGILSAIPGYLIRGETRQMLYSLFTFHKRSVTERRRLVRAGPLPPTHPWFGIDGYPDGLALTDIRRLALDTLFRPDEETRTVGLKEIEWFQPDLLDYVAFLRAAFPGARFVVNTRDVDQVAASKWWAKRPDAVAEIHEREAHILAAAEALGDAAYHVHYNEYVDDPGSLRGLFDWLGEPFDAESVRAVMARPHSY